MGASLKARGLGVSGCRGVGRKKVNQRFSCFSRLARKRGQVTIFVIVAIVVVVGIIGAIIFMGRFDADSPTELGPRAFVDKCVRDLVEESIGKVLFGGGEVVPSQAIAYLGEEWNYLCYQADFYLGCYNLHPLLEMQIEREIEIDIEDGVQGCFDSMRGGFEDRGYDVGGGAMVYSVDLLPGKVDVELRKKVDVSKGETAQSFENFDVSVPSPIYDLVSVTREIVNSEAQYCNFEYNGYMLLYPKYDIRRIDYSDSKIYRVIDRWSGEEFRFAVRSCAFAPGI